LERQWRLVISLSSNNSVSSRFLSKSNEKEKGRGDNVKGQRWSDVWRKGTEIVEGRKL